MTSAVVEHRRDVRSAGYSDWWVKGRASGSLLDMTDTKFWQPFGYKIILDPGVGIVPKRFRFATATGGAERSSRQRFMRLATRWRAKTEFMSSVTEMVIQEEYQSIIGMGEKAIPFLLGELRERPNHWFWALKAITQQDPVPEEARGKFPEMVEAWLLWGRNHGYAV